MLSWWQVLWRGFTIYRSASDGYAQLPKTCTGLQSAFAFIFELYTLSLHTSQKHCQIGDVCTSPDDLTNHRVTTPVTSNMPGCNGLLLALVLYTSKSGVTFSADVFGVLTGKKEKKKKRHECREKDKEQDGKSTRSIFWICCQILWSHHHTFLPLHHMNLFQFQEQKIYTQSTKLSKKQKANCPGSKLLNKSTRVGSYHVIHLVNFSPDFCCCCKRLCSDNQLPTAVTIVPDWQRSGQGPVYANSHLTSPPPGPWQPAQWVAAPRHGSEPPACWTTLTPGNLSPACCAPPRRTCR